MHLVLSFCCSKDKLYWTVTNFPSEMERTYVCTSMYLSLSQTQSTFEFLWLQLRTFKFLDQIYVWNLFELFCCQQKHFLIQNYFTLKRISCIKKDLYQKKCLCQISTQNFNYSLGKQSEWCLTLKNGDELYKGRHKNLIFLSCKTPSKPN